MIKILILSVLLWGSASSLERISPAHWYGNHLVVQQKEAVQTVAAKVPTPVTTTTKHRVQGVINVIYTAPKMTKRRPDKFDYG